MGYVLAGYSVVAAGLLAYALRLLARERSLRPPAAGEPAP